MLRMSAQYTELSLEKIVGRKEASKQAIKQASK